MHINISNTLRQVVSRFAETMLTVERTVIKIVSPSNLWIVERKNPTIIYKFKENKFVSKICEANYDFLFARSQFRTRLDIFRTPSTSFLN
jgi:hypothetical protein